MAGVLVDLSSLLAQADPQAPAAQRHAWLLAVLDWLRQPGPPSAYAPGDLPPPEELRPWPVRRLAHLLEVLDQQPEPRARVVALLQASLAGLDATGLLADHGFPPRPGFLSELGERLRMAWLPGTPETRDLGELFALLFAHAEDAVWLQALDAPLLARVVALLAPGSGAPGEGARQAVIESVQLLAGQVRASGLSGGMRRRMDPQALGARPFQALVQCAEDLDEPDRREAALAALPAVLAGCTRAADSVRQHLDEHGISVELVFQIEQIHARADRLLSLLPLAAAPQDLGAWQALLLHLLQRGQERRGIGRLFGRHYALLARKVTERSAETGEHYITRTRDEYRALLRQAAGGGVVIAGTTFLKFALGALGLSIFWAGFWAGMNYAASFVLVQLMHWTVATKQPAMTAPAMAARLEAVQAAAGAGGDRDAAVEGFVDEVAHLLRSQMAGILGNLLLVVPVVLLGQGLAQALVGSPLVGTASAGYVLHSLTLLGPTALFAAFTGVLLFASSLIAGWVENGFVYHRLESRLAHHPRLVRLAGAARAARWAGWWRRHISGLAANVSLGLMLGIVPAVGTFFGLPLEVRHVTLAAGQLAAAVGALGPDLLQQPAFWWCVAAIPVIGLLNLGVSFTLAFRVALASRGLRLQDRHLITQALRRRWRQQARSFFLPPH
ncbi:site-specific recombinase [Ideonella livida]|uniref:Site-specific recombinase n=1 Tax=Ideonella livida TaxID=2707176 RepID=A0A7C9PGP8_9BURK|nr:site-specific recombinase [Ideonella livida]NDY90972.1 site-specific recombinase [Ideonella livida]